MVTISIIVPTCGRSTLIPALQSVIPQLREGDEIIVIGDGEQPTARQLVERMQRSDIHYLEHGPTNFFGNAQRNLAMSLARGDMIAFLDDDDTYYATALHNIRTAASEAPNRPLMFRLRSDEPAFLIWKTPDLQVGNISGGAFVIPNQPDRIAEWPTPETRRGDWSDVTFIEDTLALYPDDALVWREELIYHVVTRSYNAS